jgi:hypothetical protein
MGQVVFRLHTLHPPEIENAEVIEAICEEKRLDLRFSGSGDLTTDDMRKLKEFRYNVFEQGWSVTPEAVFHRDLEKKGLISAVGEGARRQTGISHATGSPSKKLLRPGHVDNQAVHDMGTDHASRNPSKKQKLC